MDMPGVRNDDLEFSLEDDTLNVKAERNAAVPEDYQPRRRELLDKVILRRSFTLGNAVDIEHIQADLQDGVLTDHPAEEPEEPAASDRGQVAAAVIDGPDSRRRASRPRLFSGQTRAARRSAPWHNAAHETHHLHAGGRPATRAGPERNRRRRSAGGRPYAARQLARPVRRPGPGARGARRLTPLRPRDGEAAPGGQPLPLPFVDLARGRGCCRR